MDWRAFVVFSTTLLRDELDSEVFRTQTIFHSLPNISTGKKKHSTENVLPHDESGHPQNMPVQIVGVLAVGSQMKPQHENVMWQKAQDKHYANDGWKTEQMFHSICILQSKDLNISIRSVSAYSLFIICFFYPFVDIVEWVMSHAILWIIWLIVLLTDDKSDYHSGDVSSGARLCTTLRPGQLAGHFAGTQMQSPRHQQIQHTDNWQRQEVVDNCFSNDVVSAWEKLRERDEIIDD